MKRDRLDAGDRRSFLCGAATAAGSLIVGAASPRTLAAEDEEQEWAISPAEDLMREHGVLKRILLVYEEGIRRLDAGEDLPPQTIHKSAEIIRSFVENYHEMLEEKHIFPRFRKAGKLVDLVDVLADQHQAGRGLTDTVLRLSTAQAVRDADDRKTLVRALRQFIRMYSPHEAREDTVLFPALRTIVSPNEYAALGEDFEHTEHERFGEDGFSQTVQRVASIEKELGIYALAKFTP